MQDGTVFIYDVLSGKLQSYFYAHKDVVSSVNIHPFSNYFVSSSGQREYILNSQDSDFSEDDEDKEASTGKHNIRIWDINQIY